MGPVAVPDHIGWICHDWHGGENSEIYKFVTHAEFDPAGVVREIEQIKAKLSEDGKEKHLGQLNKLKRYVMNLVQDYVREQKK